MAVGQTAMVRRAPNGAALPSIDGVRFGNRSLEIDGNIAFEDWQHLGETLRVFEGGVLWWIGDWLNYGERRYGEKHAQAIEATGLDYSSLSNAKWVSGRFEFSRRRENLSWSHHAEAAALEPSDAEALLDTAESEGWSKRELRKQVVLFKQRHLTPPDFPPGVYRVLYADPPWQYGDERTLSDTSGAALTQYPTMATDAICALADKSGRRIQDISGEDSVCFLWATAPLLTDALAVLAAWGFTYKAMFVWDKQRSYNGHYNAVRHEMLLIGTKGSATPDAKELHDSVIASERTKHSRKPEEFYGVVESMYTRGPYVEIFAREKRDGWAAFGNQV